MSVTLLSHFQVEVDRADGAGVLKLHGELDLASSVLLTEELEKLSTVEFVIIDLSDVAFIDSSGIGVLVKAHQAAVEEGKRFALVNGTGQVAQMLELTGLAEQLTVVDALAELLDG